MRTASDHEETPDDPAAMLRLLRDQERRTQRWSQRTYAVMLVVWALAWAVGFGFLWSAETTGGSPWPRVPQQLAWIVFGVAMAVAIVVSIVAGVRSGIGVRGPSKLAGAMYGWSWTISMSGAAFIIGAVQRAGLPPTTIGILAPAMFALLTGALYLAGGALWRSPAQFALGCVMIATAVTASFVGAPTHYLIYATVGGGAMLISAVLLARGVLPYESAR
ncbi:hypothetical protein [Microbacterium sp. No. 7]|uniref:hypothetical protein n=1 Tax=Microbacterium sp. No. 7 TaxID=1714373 RepID=UPI000A557F1F|nr:hypothetical protein [Microbacterium sp. No. 7]